jgi:hypothetical protein
MIVYGIVMPCDYCMTYVFLEKNLEFNPIRKYNWINKLRRIHPDNMSARFSYVLSCDSAKRTCEKITDDGRIQLWQYLV